MTDQREPVAAVKARSDEAQGEPVELRPVPFCSHPDLGASVMAARHWVMSPKRISGTCGKALGGNG